LVREQALSDGDLLLFGGQLGRGRVLAAAAGNPRVGRELADATVVNPSGLQHI
jgi:hypothetical protein